MNRGEWSRLNGPKWTEVNWIDQTRPIWYVSSLMITWTMDLRCNWQRMLLALPIWNDPVEKHGLKWKDARSQWVTSNVLRGKNKGHNLCLWHKPQQYHRKTKKIYKSKSSTKQTPLPAIHKWYSMPVNYQMVLTGERSTIEELLYPKDCFTRKAPHPKKKNGKDKENNVTYTYNSSQINKYINLWYKTDMLKTWSQWAWTQMAFPPPMRKDRV